MPKPSWENMSVYFSENDFAVIAQILTPDGIITVNGIYDDAIYIRDIGEADMTQSQPRFICATEEVLNAQRGMSVTIDNKTHKIIDVTADGTGLSTMMLSK